MRKSLYPCILSLSLILPRIAAADSPYDPVEADKLFDAGVALRDQGKYKEALAAFWASRIQDSSDGTLLNIANCEQHLGLLATALGHFRVIVSHAAENQARADLAAEYITALEPRVPKLRLTLAKSLPPKTVVLLDGAALDPESLGGALAVDPGTHVILVRAEGRPDKRYQVEAKEGVATPLEVDAGQALTPAAPPTSPEAPPAANNAPPNAAKSGPSHTPALALLGLGGVGLVIGGALIGVSGSSSSRADKLDAEGASCAPGGDPQIAVRCREADGARASAGALGTAGSVSLVIGGLTAATGLAFLVWPEAKRPSSSGVKVHVAPSASLTEQGIFVQGSF